MLNRIYPDIFRRFFRSSSASGVLLLFCVLLSLTIANTSPGEGFASALSTKWGYENNWIHLNYSNITWINDGLMSIFFLLVGLEIKREIVQGELSSARKASLPVLAAIGGVITPALIYAAFNSSSPATVNGWGIPMATDIAFALGVLSLLGERVPAGLKIFLAALAIVDDLIAILVIAICYTSDLHFNYLACAGAIFLALIVLNRLNVKNLLFYILPGILMWYCIHHSGIHPTIAGVLTAITLPKNKDSGESPLDKLEHMLTRPVNFIVMPVFAIANTNIAFKTGMIDGLASNMTLGILFGLFVGKPVGIWLMSWISVKLRIADLPSATSWTHVLGLGLLGGIGFTMSIFIALLSFQAPDYQTEAKFAILIASLLSGTTGFLLLKRYNNKEKSI